MRYEFKFPDNIASIQRRFNRITGGQCENFGKFNRTVTNIAIK